MSEQGPNCFKCRYFYITHLPAHPYGCRAMKFKSRQLPSLVVLTNSGMQCQLFRAKE